MSYHQLERIDIGVDTRSTESAGQNRVPVPENIENSIVINGPMNNFHNKEGTRSRIRSSHDRILMLIQNAYDSVKDHPLKISKQLSNLSSNKRSLEYILNCRKSVRYGRFLTRVEVPHHFQIKKDSVEDQIKIAASEIIKHGFLHAI